MERANHVEQHLVAYCIGNPQDLSHKRNHYSETLEEIRRTGQEVWCFSDQIGVIRTATRMYVWMQSCIADELIEGQIFEFDNIDELILVVGDLRPEITVEQKMQIVRQLQVRHALNRH